MMTDYKELYLLHCANLSDCTTKEDVKRHNAAMKQLGKLFYQIQDELDKSFLLELLSNENDRTYHNGDACWYLVQSSHIRFFGRYRPKEQVTGG